MHGQRHIGPRRRVEAVNKDTPVREPLDVGFIKLGKPLG